MIKYSDIKAPTDFDISWIEEFLAHKLKIKRSEIKEIKLIKKSVDARKKSDVHFVITVAARLEDEARVLGKSKHDRNLSIYKAPKALVFKKASLSERPVVAGFGPAGIFAALVLARCGANPIVLERGDDVDTRQKKVEKFWRDGTLDSESNVQFGEGGAGTFSDGKLNTGVNSPLGFTVFNEFVKHGAPNEILYEAKPHIGTDRLSETVKSIRREIISLGGEVIFGARLIDIEKKNGRLIGVRYIRKGTEYGIATNALILATGHSARDIFSLMQRHGISLCHKNFSVGLRIEHTAEELNRSMYGEFANHPALSAADYKLAVHDENGRGIYTFCMCPGGVVVASADKKETIVTNGMSKFARNAENSNSALLVGITENDLDISDIMSGVKFQEKIEHAAFVAAGGNYKAPCCMVGDFLQGKLSADFGSVKPSYLPGTSPVLPDSYLPDFVCKSLRFALPQFAKKIQCFNNPEAVLTGPETRSSSPIRIVRGDNLQSVSLKGLYPCAEGAGYAGGIVTAAIDGIKCALAVLGEG